MRRFVIFGLLAFFLFGDLGFIDGILPVPILPGISIPCLRLRIGFLIVDGVTVETESFNMTTAAEKSNAENVLILHNATIAAHYGKEWDRLWAESEAYAGGTINTCSFSSRFQPHLCSSGLKTE